MYLPEDVLAQVLAYAGRPHDLASRRWCLNKAWLDAHASPLHWRTLTLSIMLPLDEGAHSLCSAWARAPQQLRRAVERHTSEFCLETRGWRPGQTIAPQTMYSLGRGLAGQNLSALKIVRLRVDDSNYASMQSYAEDVAALRPLFGAEIFDGEAFGCWRHRGAKVQLRTRAERELDLDFLSDHNRGAVYRCFRNLCSLHLTDWSTTVFLKTNPDNTKIVDRALTTNWWGEPSLFAENVTHLDREQAVQLVELQSLDLDSFVRGPVPPDNFFPRLRLLQLGDLETPIERLEVVFARVAAVCPALEILTLDIGCEHDTWGYPENYSVFAHAPRNLKALVLSLREMTLPFPTPSPLVALIQRYLPTGVQVHLQGDGDNIKQDDLLPKAFWDPHEFPKVGERYDDATLARASFAVM